MLYGTECWVIEKQHVQKMSVVEIKMLGWISENSRKYRIWNEETHLKIGVARWKDNGVT